jgi:hypothetical protein
MATAISNAERVVATLVKSLDKDVERVLALYNSLDPQFRNVSPQMDSILDGLDNWLIKKRWLDRFNQDAHGDRDVVDEHGNHVTINLDHIEWD